MSATGVGPRAEAAADARLASDPLAGVRLAVVKVGSALVAGEDGQPRGGWLAGVAADIAALRARGTKIVAVSSGAVALGRGILGLPRRTLTLAQKQAAAAAGQSRLMRAWEEALRGEGLAAAQILLTPDDTEVRRRFLNARSTLETLLACGAVPVVNENDTVATQELRYGDNDRLAARVAQMAGAEALVLLSDVDGLYTADPRRDTAALHIPEVSRIDATIEALAGDAAVGGVGTGGMASKVAAAKIAAQVGCATIIAPGAGAHPLAALARGGRCTIFRAAASPAAAYKAWIAGTLKPQGTLHLDAGAAAAVRGGASLLAAGVSAVSGAFGKGDAVVLRDPDGAEIGRGLVRYDARDAAKVAGLTSARIEAALGYAGGPLVHADDLALASQPALSDPV